MRTFSESELQVPSAQRPNAPSNGFLWFLVVGGVLVRLIFFLTTKYVSDDAFITYRYVLNIISGYGYLYNEGEKVLGTTSPLYTLLLSFLSLAFGGSHVVVISFLLSLISDMFVLIILWRLIPGEFVVARFVSVGLFSLYPKTVLIGVSGMESSLALLLMLFSLQCYLGKRYYLCAFVLGMHFFCRPDAVLWDVLLAGFIFFREAEIRIRYVAASVIVPGIWTVFSHWYFNSWFPHSITAKRISWHHLFPAFDPVRVLSGYLPSSILGHNNGWLMYCMVILFLIPFCIGSMRIVRSKSYMLLFPIFFVMYNVAFSFAGVVMADWYFLPGFLAYFIVCGYCAEYMFEWFRRSNSSRKMKLLLGYGCVTILLVLNIAGMLRWNDNLSGLFQRQNKSLGEWLGTHAASNQSVLVEPIGYIGFYSKKYIYDYIGIVSPSVLSFRQQYSSDRWFMEFVQTVKPDFIVLRNWEVPSNHLFHGYGDGIFHSDQEREWFENHYQSISWDDHAQQDTTFLVLYGLRHRQFAFDL